MDEQLLTLERAGWDALCDGTASAFYAAHMAPDGLMVLANGQVMTRDEVVAALRDAPPWGSYEIDDPRVVAVADGVAALVYVGTGHRHGADPFVGAMSSLYRRDAGGAWELVLYQQTAVAPASAG